MLADIALALTQIHYEPHPKLHCWRCDEYKDRSEFGIRLTKLQSTCKPCNRAYQKQWYRLAKNEGRR